MRRLFMEWKMRRWLPVFLVKLSLALAVALLGAAAPGSPPIALEDQIFEGQDHVVRLRNNFPDVFISVEKKSGGVVKKISRQDILNDQSSSKSDTASFGGPGGIPGIEFLGFDDTDNNGFLGFAVQLNSTSRFQEYDVYTWDLHLPNNSLIAWDRFEASRIVGGYLSPDCFFLLYEFETYNSIFSPTIRISRIAMSVNQFDKEQFPVGESHEGLVVSQNSKISPFRPFSIPW